MSNPKLPPEWADWDAPNQRSHLMSTRTRAELHVAILDVLGLPSREFSGEIQHHELASVLVALLAGVGDDPNDVVFPLSPTDD